MSFFLFGLGPLESTIVLAIAMLLFCKGFPPMEPGGPFTFGFGSVTVDDPQ